MGVCVCVSVSVCVRVCVCVCVCVCITHSHIHTHTCALLLYVYSYIFRYIYGLLVVYSCFTSLEICNCCNPVLLQYTHSYSCCTRTLLVLFLECVLCVLCLCVCVPAYWPSRVCACSTVRG
jgi:hypothetical protein